VALFNVVCSSSTLYELYSDILVAVISIYNDLPGGFGFFAVMIPILNRVLQIYVCCKLFTSGVKLRSKTLGGAKLDKHLMYLGLHNMSRLLFPLNTDFTATWVTLMIIKECTIKLIQIVLKLVLLTETFSDKCSRNVGTLALMIGANILSLL
jgi:hypothetical protein